MRKLLILASLLLSSCGKPAPEKPPVQEQPKKEFQLPSNTRQESPLARMPEGEAARERGADAFYFDKKDYTRDEFTVRVVYYDNLRILKRAYQNFGGSHGGTIYSFSVDRNGVCEIHTMDPEVWYIPQYVGHEVMHCVHGKFHA